MSSVSWADAVTLRMAATARVDSTSLVVFMLSLPEFIGFLSCPTMGSEMLVRIGQRGLLRRVRLGALQVPDHPQPFLFTGIKRESLEKGATRSKKSCRLASSPRLRNVLPAFWQWVSFKSSHPPLRSWRRCFACFAVRTQRHGPQRSRRPRKVREETLRPLAKLTHCLRFQYLDIDHPRG